MPSIRLLALDDVPALTELHRRNRDHLQPWEPMRADSWFTTEGQLAAARAALEGHADGTSHPCVILDDDGRLVGRIGLSSIIRGALQSGSVGYWVSADAQGRGIATAALRSLVQVAFGELDLHRVQGETLTHNTGSQKVLERAGFVRYGMAPDYLRIAGRWQDCALFQLIA
ncbi:GNAT family N-acetyltransferase [Aeromicrobium wangtongii]|uniref:GNAT family N-acetyltransferase n=1 Tax=Aeromicrobium wangtongii TaxID=2969247 RepID=UPI002016AE39|nr:GNAT family protein [Aeromicrobium wangtongii]MCL3820331.1 GNAT family N-acetyltransferase [Aeromicrobium wangtongii]